MFWHKNYPKQCENKSKVEKLFSFIIEDLFTRRSFKRALITNFDMNHLP